MEKNNLVSVNVRSRSGGLVQTSGQLMGRKAGKDETRGDLHSENPASPHRPA